MSGERSKPKEAKPTHPFLRWADVLPLHAPWAAFATIRHSNMCLFTFHHLSLPEDLDAMTVCLQQLCRLWGGSVRDVVEKLLAFFDPRDGDAITATSERILELRTEWLKDHSSFTGEPHPLMVLFCFRTFLRTSDWQMVRDLSCISCSPRAMSLLQKAHGLCAPEATNYIWRPTDTNAFSSSSFNWLRSLTGKDATTAAMNSTTLILTRGYSPNHPDVISYQWNYADPTNYLSKGLSALASVDAHPSVSISSVDIGNSLMEVLERPLPPDLSGVLGTQFTIPRGAVLFHKGSHWPGPTPAWCLMVLDDIDFHDDTEVRRTLEQAKNSGIFYVFTQAGTFEEPGKPTRKLVDRDVDRRFLDTWANEF